MIDGQRILTNAHAVEYGSLIQVKKRQCEKKYVASVVALGHECRNHSIEFSTLAWRSCLIDLLLVSKAT